MVLLDNIQVPHAPVRNVRQLLDHTYVFKISVMGIHPSFKNGITKHVRQRVGDHRGQTPEVDVIENFTWTIENWVF